MHARFALGALMLTWLVLVAAVPACSSSAPAGGNANANGVDWAEMHVSADNGPGLQPVPSVQEMENTGGFAFVFPSYLPAGNSDNIAVAAWKETTNVTFGVVQKGGPGERVKIYQARTDAPFVTVTEGMKPFQSGFADMSSLPDHTTVSSIDVGCVDIDMGDFGQIRECDWVVGDEGFRVEAQWTDANEMTDDMRQEAMKVVESMIVAPEHP